MVRLLQQDRIDEALAACAASSTRLPADAAVNYTASELTRRAEQAAAAGKVADALCYSEAFLRHVPFAGGWGGNAEGWGGVAAAYLDLLARTERPSAEWFRQSRVSAAAFARLRAATDDGNEAEIIRVGSEILDRHPRSLFAVPAAVSVVVAVRGQGYADEIEAARVKTAELLRKLTAAGVSETDRLPLRMQQFYSTHVATALVEEAAEAARVARGPLARRAAWEAVLAHRATDREWDAARAAGRAVVATYASAARPMGRALMLRAYHEPDALPEVERWLADWRRAGESFDEGAALHQVARVSHYSLGENPADATADQVARTVARYEAALAAKTADRAWTDAARQSLAHLYDIAGNSGRRLAVLADAAAADPASEANPTLARHFATAGDPARALKYWERWTPRPSGCFTCDMGVRAERAQGIADAKAALTAGKPSPP